MAAPRPLPPVGRHPDAQTHQHRPLSVPTDQTETSSVRTNHSRSSSIYVMDEVDDGEDSEADSVLSFWSDDGESDSETPAESDAAAKEEEEREHKDSERKRREAERQKHLDAAGLKIRRAAPGVPSRPRRRPAPAVPVRREHPKHDVEQNGGANAPEHEHEHEHAAGAEAPIQVEDAYARYEAFLAEAKSKPPARRNSHVPKVHSEIVLPTSPTATTSAPQSATQKLTGFISRMTGTGQQAAPRPTPVISRPVSSGPISAPQAPMPPDDGDDDDAFAQGFGQTWSSLVDASVLATMDDQERKRQEAMFELIATETTYVADVQLLVGVWYRRLMGLLDEQSLGVIFANIEDIMMFNSRLLSMLEERQKLCRLYIDTIADVLLDNLKDLDVYIPYCLNQENARRLLVQLRRQRPELDRELVSIRENEPAVRGLDLSSFLLEPSTSHREEKALTDSAARDALPPAAAAGAALHARRPGRGAARGRARDRRGHDGAHQRERARGRVARPPAHTQRRALGRRRGPSRPDSPDRAPGPAQAAEGGPGDQGQERAQAVARAVQRHRAPNRKRQAVPYGESPLATSLSARDPNIQPISLFDLAIATGPDTTFALVHGARKDTVRLKAPSSAQRAEWVALLNRARKDAIAAKQDAVAARRQSAMSFDSRGSRGERSDRRASASASASRRVSTLSQSSFASVPIPASPGLAHALPPGAAAPTHPHSGSPGHSRSLSNPLEAFGPGYEGRHVRPASPNQPAAYSDRELAQHAQRYDDMLGAREPVYDDAHSYAGQGRSMYEHEF